MISNLGCGCLVLQDALLLSSRVDGSLWHVGLCHCDQQMQVAMTCYVVQLPSLLAPKYRLLITNAHMYVTDNCLTMLFPCFAPTQSAMTTLVADTP